jgi:hypothetical protein
MKRTLLLTIILLLLFAACKYEDGPLISFRSKYQRLISGKWWVLENLKINGADSTQLYNDSCGCVLQISTPDENERRYIHYYCISENDITWDCAFNNHKKELDVRGKPIITPYIQPFKVIGPIGCGQETEWKIMKLTNNEFWFQVDMNQRIYFFKYKKQKS